MARPDLKTDPFPARRERDEVGAWLERRLKGRDDAAIRALATRFTLRSLPFLSSILNIDQTTGRKSGSEFLLACLRGYPISAGAALVPPAEIEAFFSIADPYSAFGQARSAAKAVEAYATSRSNRVDRYPVAADVSATRRSEDEAAHTAAIAARSAANVVYAAYNTAVSADAFSGGDALALAAFEQDCVYLEQVGVEGVLCAPLWPFLADDLSSSYAERFPDFEARGGVPPKIAAQWIKFRKSLRGHKKDFGIWTEWYEGILVGEQNGRYLFDLPTERALRLNVDFALIDDALWKGDPAKLHAEMRRLIEVARGEEAGQVPEHKPAALEPIYVDGRLVLPGGPLHHESEPDNLLGALAALRLDFEELAGDCDGVANIAEADVQSLRWVAQRIPLIEPTSLELHRVAHLEKALEVYGGKASEQWPDFLAARYHALSMQFSSVMNQFPNWKDFKRVANSSKLSPKQVEDVPRVVELANQVLRPADAANAISAEIPDQLQKLAEPLANTGEAPAFDPIAVGMELLAEDVLESFNNILKRIAQGALAFKFGIEKVGGQGWTKFVKGLEKGVEEEAEKAGKRFGKTLVWVLVGSIPGVGGAYGATWLWTTYPEKFGWLKWVISLLA